MADNQIEHVTVDTVPRDDYTNLEVVLWVIGILAIPGVPILMVWLFTPHSGY